MQREYQTYTEPHFSAAKEVMQHSKAVKPLKSVTAAQIEDSKLQPPPFIIDGILPAGMTIFAAPPKTGKSWFCLDMACSIATGQPFLGRRCTPGTVLYLDLESKDYRVQDRLKKAGLTGPENLHLVFESERLNGGLLEQLATWKEHHPDTTVVIVDTLGRVKGVQAKNSDAYTADTVSLAPLQAWALNNGVALICVTHLRKTGSARYEADADPFERITGSNAQFGVADTAWIIAGKRSSDEMRFVASGRDIESIDLAITFDKKHCRWICLGDAVSREAIIARRNYEENPIVQAIREGLRESNTGHFQCTANDLFNRILSYRDTAVSGTVDMGRKLNMLSEQLYAYDRIVYRKSNSRRNNGRMHSFCYERKEPLCAKQLSLMANSPEHATS